MQLGDLTGAYGARFESLLSAVTGRVTAGADLKRIGVTTDQIAAKLVTTLGSHQVRVACRIPRRDHGRCPPDLRKAADAPKGDPMSPRLPAKLFTREDFRSFPASSSSRRAVDRSFLIPRRIVANGRHPANALRRLECQRLQLR